MPGVSCYVVILNITNSRTIRNTKFYGVRVRIKGTRIANQGLPVGHIATKAVDIKKKKKRTTLNC